MIKNKRINKKKIFTTLTEINGLDKEKQLIFDNMKHDFAAHLSDKQSDRNDRHRRAIAAIRQSFQSLLMQIPSNIQNLTIEDIYLKGGSIELIDDPNLHKSFTVQIPKSMLSSTNELSHVISQKKSNEMFKEPYLQKLAVMRSASENKKTAQKARVLTRSSAKNNFGREVLIGNKALEPTNDKMKSTAKSVKSGSKEPLKDEQMILKSLSSGHLKPPRKPNPNEEIITLAFSSSGTPLLVDNKCLQRIDKSD